MFYSDSLEVLNPSKELEENKMTNYMFNIGNYVEKVNGDIGYIYDITSTGAIKVRWTNENLKEKITVFRFKALKPTNSYFKRIGRYTFQSEPEKKENIEPLLNIKYDYDRQNDRELRQNLRYDMWNCVKKINEIIDYLNKG